MKIGFLIERTNLQAVTGNLVRLSVAMQFSCSAGIPTTQKF